MSDANKTPVRFRYYVRNKIIVGASIVALGSLLWGLEGLILAALAVALLAIPSRRSRKYAVRLVA